MSFPAKIAQQAVTTTNATAGIAVPAGEIWTIRSINLQQPTASDAKIVSVGIGTTVTAVNVFFSKTLAAGQTATTDYPGTVMVAGDQINVVATGTTAQCVITINVIKQKIA